MKREVLLGAATILFCAALFYEAALIPDYGFAQVGADVWPKIILGVVSVLALLQMVQGFYRPQATPASQAGQRNPRESWLFRAFVPFTVFAAVVLFAVFVPYIGFMLSGLIMVFMLLSIIGQKSPRTLLIHAVISVVSVLCVTVFFSEVMGVLLPEWTL